MASSSVAMPSSSWCARRVGRPTSLPVDELGNFSLDQPAVGIDPTGVGTVSEGRRIHTDWFVV